MPDIELAGSFLIGGMIILALLNLNNSIMETTTMNNLEIIAQRNAIGISEIINYDLRKIGYNVASGVNPVTALTDTTITILADIDNDLAVDTVSYRIGAASELTDTDNPNDRYIYRTLNGTEFDIGMGISQFTFTFYDQSKAVTTTPSVVNSIEIDFTVETTIGLNDEYGQANWVGRIYPPNLSK